MTRTRIERDESEAEAPKTCSGCKLSEKRTRVVPGEGPIGARLMLVGERPGPEEEQEGRPFRGPAGMLLEKMVEAIGLKREQVFMTHLVQCRPPEDRSPEPDELQACSGHLFEEMERVRPQVIIALGKLASQTLLKTEEPFSDLRGRFHPYRVAHHQSRLMPTFHPGYLLHNPSAKKEAWADLQLVAAELGIKIRSKNS